MASPFRTREEAAATASAAATSARKYEIESTGRGDTRTAKIWADWATILERDAAEFAAGVHDAVIYDR